MDRESLLKLKMLSLVTLASQNSVLLYNNVQTLLDFATSKEVEELILEAIYHHLLIGKMDSLLRCFHVSFAIARNISNFDINALTNALTLWLNASESVALQLEEKIKSANEQFEDETNQKLIQEMRITDAIAQAEVSKVFNFFSLRLNREEKKRWIFWETPNWIENADCITEYKNRNHWHHL